MTQAELGAALGWGDKGANRLAQYETNYRVPRKDLVTEMAKILDVSPLALHEPTTMDASELMEILFWIDEFTPAAINSGEITRNEYFEWKINWPQTCDGCGKYEPKKQWRSANTELSET